MHTRRKRGGGTWKIVLAVILIAIIAACGALAAWYFWPYQTKHDTQSAAVPTGTIRGLAVHTGTDSEFAKNTTSAAQQMYFDTLIDFAVDNEINALFVDVIEAAGDGEKPAALYRDRGTDAYPCIAANDTLLNTFTRFDALKYLCKEAANADISVFASVDEALKDNEDIAVSLARMYKKYELAGVYYRSTAQGALGTLAPENAELPALIYTQKAAWDIANSDLYAACVKDDFNGAVIDDYETAKTQAATFGMLLACLDNKPDAYTLVNYTPQASLSITYPAEGEKIYTSTCFVMGTSDPNEKLYLNGEEIERTTTSGLFGTLVTLSKGENTLEFKNGQQSLNYVINRIVSTSSGSSSTSSEMQHDGTVEVDEGAAVRVNGLIAGLLYNPSSDGNISETARQGATARVVSCVETVRSGKKTWAYKLASGDYVLAYNTAYIGTDYTNPVFTGAVAEQTASGETITFTGAGQPLIYASTRGNDLVLHVYDASLQPGFAITGSSMIKACAVNMLENSTELIITFNSPLWGYTFKYGDNKTTLYLNDTPVMGDDAEKPLAGTSVLLDPGHGDTSPGAMGTAGSAQPTEKDVNLAVALAARQRLEALGATVYMTREDGTFLELTERNQMITDVQPDFFISVHHNSIALTSDANNAGGIECYYFDENAKPLAEALVANMVAQTGRSERGAYWGYYYVTRNTTCPAVLLECGFMVNPSEYENVTDNDIIWRSGYAIAQSVYETVKNSGVSAI